MGMCQKCGGNGTVICSECNGTGYKKRESAGLIDDVAQVAHDLAFGPDECDECDNGKVDCGCCGGSGECDNCD